MSSESVSSESVNSESESYPSEDEQTDETGKDVSKTKNKSAGKRKPAKKPNSGTSRNTKQSKNTLGRRTNSNAMTNEELEDLCFELDEKKEELLAYTREKLKAAGDINFFKSRGLLRSAVISKLPELLDEVNELVIETMRNFIRKKSFESRKKGFSSLTAGHKRCLRCYKTRYGVASS